MGSEVFGVPLHPLVVHGVVVLLPLAAVLGVLAVVPRFRRRLAPVAAGLAVAATLFIPVATWSGERLLSQVAEATPLTSRHVDLAGGLLPWALLLVAGTLLLLLASRPGLVRLPWTSLGRSHAPGLVGFVSVLVVVSSVGSVVKVVQIGHSGSAAVYDHVTEHGHGEPEVAGRVLERPASDGPHGHASGTVPHEDPQVGAEAPADPATGSSGAHADERRTDSPGAPPHPHGEAPGAPTATSDASSHDSDAAGAGDHVDVPGAAPHGH